MALEDDAPTRAEIEAVLWTTRSWEEQERRLTLLNFLRDRGLDNRYCDAILSDIESYRNWNADASS